MATTEPKLIGTIDLTPTWAALVPVLVEVAANGNSSKARSDAFAELMNLARFADAINAERKAEQS